ncbi:MAG: NAD(P)/FAD-dependent oxidoreductase [Phycisphaeraceae bacterium]
MRQCDVLVVGGGPAGSSFAWQLRQAGLDVVILDKKDFPRDKICAGWVTPPVFEALKVDLDDYAKDGRVLQPITGFYVGRVDGKQLLPGVASHYDDPVSYGIRRCEFDEYLLRRCGAELALGVAVKSIERRDDRWVINDAYEAPLLVGAGGHFCPVARKLNSGGGAAKELIVAAQEIEFPMTSEQQAACKVDAHVPELYFCSDLAGYAWCFRKGDHLNIGLGREDSQRLSDHVADFAEALKRAGRVPADIPTKFHGHAYILYGHTQRQTVDDGVMLIGDAAGLAYPQSGEGIRSAIESALMAAQLIASTPRGPEWVARTTLEKYRRLLVKRFGEPGSSDPNAHRTPSGLKASVAGFLLKRHWFVRHVVMDRWFLHRHQPALQVAE